MRDWFEICAACTPTSSTTTPITRPIRLFPENAKITNASEISAIDKVRTARGPRLSAERPAHGAASAPTATDEPDPQFVPVKEAQAARKQGADSVAPKAADGTGALAAGVGKPLVEKFSRRTAQIEKKARQMGIDDAAAKSELGAKTRQHKQKALSFPELQDTWRRWMSPEELDILAALERKIGGDAEPAQRRPGPQ